MASQTTQQPILENRSRGRRPILSTKAAPRSAKQNCWQLLMRITFACPMVLVTPMVVNTLPMKYDKTAAEISICE